MGIDLQKAHEEFHSLKVQESVRNNEYYLLRQAVKGNFRWPRNWPGHIQKHNRNLCKRISRQYATYLIGKGFSYNINRPNTLDYRESAERAEKTLRRLLVLSRAELQFLMGSLTGAQLGRTVFKVYKKGKKPNQHACFTYCQPDYFYGIPAGDDHLGDFSAVYYSYPLDIAEARRIYGDKDYKTAENLDRGYRYTDKPDEEFSLTQARRVPVLESWTKEDYALEVGGITIYNGANPNKWKATGEGFIPYVVIENNRNGGEGLGEADISEARELNELYNRLFSLKNHIVDRYLRPTVVWEGAPQNYAEILAATLGGGGAIPTRLGSRLYFLVHDRPNQAVLELTNETRAAILESCGMTELALQGQLPGGINTGPSTANQFTSLLATVETKRTEWDFGLESLFAMLLEIQEQIGDSDALGEAVVNESAFNKSANNSDGEVVKLSGKDINGLREVTVSWPGVLPKDSIEAARLEMEKASQGLQSIYTTLEKLGEDYPSDEIARIRMENQDPSLRGEKVAEQVRAQTPLFRAQADTQMRQQEFEAEQNQATQQALAELAATDLAQQEDENDIGYRIRQAARSASARPRLSDEDDPAVLAPVY